MKCVGQGAKYDHRKAQVEHVSETHRVLQLEAEVLLLGQDPEIFQAVFRKRCTI